MCMRAPQRCMNTPPPAKVDTSRTRHHTRQACYGGTLGAHRVHVNTRSDVLRHEFASSDEFCRFAHVAGMQGALRRLPRVLSMQPAACIVVKGPRLRVVNW